MLAMAQGGWEHAAKKTRDASIEWKVAIALEMRAGGFERAAAAAEPTDPSRLLGHVD